MKHGKSNFRVEFDLEGHGQSTTKILKIFPKVFTPVVQILS